MILFSTGKRIPHDELVNAIRRHGFSEKNAVVAVSRLATLVDDDRHGNLKLRLKGIREAEKLVEEHSTE